MADNIQLNAGSDGDILAAKDISGVKYQNVHNTSEYLFSSYVTGLQVGGEIDSDWLDMEQVDKYQFEGMTSITGFNMYIESSTGPTGSEANIATNTTITTTFHLFNVIARNRYIRFKWQNTSTGVATDCAMAIKAGYGNTDKLSTFPLATEPTNFSQAALVQSVVKGQQPDGDYVNTPADGGSFTETGVLTADQTFTGVWIDSDGFKSIELFIESDVPGATSGICVDFTDDAQADTPAVRSTSFYSYTQADADIGSMILRIAPGLDGYRVRYKNGDQAQGNFFMISTLRNANTESPQQMIESTIDKGVVAGISRSIISVRDQNAQYRNVPGNEQGALLVGDFDLEAARGNIPAYKTVAKFGYNPDVDAGPEDVWNSGGNYTGHPTGLTPETLQLFSSSAADANGGTGMTSVKIYGLESPTSTQETSEEITLSGTTTVTSANSWYRIYRAHGLNYGTGQINAGQITIRHSSTTSNVFALIPAGQGQTTISAFTIPSGHVGYMKALNIGIGRSNGSAGSADVSFRVRDFGTNGYNAKRYYTTTTSFPVNTNFVFPIKLEPLSDIKVRCESVSDTNTAVSAEFDIILISGSQ